MKVALVNVYGILRSLPLSLGNLVAYARREPEIAKRVEFEIFHLRPRASHDEDVRAILDFGADVVGFSTYSWNTYAHSSIARDLKQARPDILTVFGGPHVSGDSRDLLEETPSIDLIIDGEGELAFSKLLQVLLHTEGRREDLGQSPNLRFLHGDELVATPNAQRISDLDDIPSPYLTGVLNPRLPMALWETNRGCPYRCAYCYWGNGHAKLYQHSMDRLEEELHWFAKHGVRYFFNVDSNFGIFKRDAEIADLIARIQEEQDSPFDEFLMSWAKNSSDRVVEIASTFQNHRINSPITLALQTLTPEAAEISKRKSLPLEKCSELVSLAKQRNLVVYTDLIWGLPGESLSDFRVGLDKVVDLGMPQVFVFALELIRGTELFAKRKELGLTTSPSAATGQELVLSHPKMTRADQTAGLRLIILHHVFHTIKFFHLVNRYLRMEFGLRHTEICGRFEEYLYEPETGLVGKPEALRTTLRDILDTATQAERADIDRHPNRALFALWDSTAAVEELFISFYLGYLLSDRSLPSHEKDVLHELLSYGLLTAPKPGWKPDGTYSFSYDFAEHAEEVLQHWGEEANYPTPKLVRDACTYRIENPFHQRPNISNSWMLRFMSKNMCKSVKLGRIRDGVDVAAEGREGRRAERQPRVEEGAGVRRGSVTTGK